MIKKFSQALLNLGVYEGMPVYEYHRVRFINFLELIAQAIFVFYCLFGLYIHTPFLSCITFSMVASGITGLYLHHKKAYRFARTMFLTPFSVLLMLICNVMDAGPY